MRIPRTVKVGAYTYTVRKKKKLEKVDNSSVWGLCDRDNWIIYLQSGMDKKREIEVFLHECIHAIETGYGLSFTEHEVNLLGLALLALINDNKLRFL
jgi:hypothetical protein